MRKLTEFSVKYPVTILMVVLGIILLGYISFDKLGIDLFPNMNNPRIFVQMEAGERSPEEIEEQFVDRIESLSRRQSNVVQVTSVTRTGSAIITVEYAWNADMDEAFLDLQKSLTVYSQHDDLDNFVITQDDPNSAPIMVVGLSNESIEDMNELRKTAENYIRNELIRLEGIADVQIAGQEEQEVIVSTNKYLLESYNLTASAVAQKIQAYNRDISGGSIEESGTRYIIKGVSAVKNPIDIENIIVSYTSVDNSSDRVPVFLKEVAEVKLGNKDPDNIVRINGERCLALSIYKETSFNTVQAIEILQDDLEQIKRSLPGYEFIVVENQGSFISSSIGEVKDSLILGILFAIIVLFLFLRRIGSTLIVSVSIPISIIATFNLMYFNGLTLNIMTLGGLALGAGMLVDNAIVVMENIFRNRENGMSVKEAAITGTAEVGGAITASTLTTIVIFLPIVYMQGVSGELFKDQAWTVAFSLLSSLFVAILVIPVLYSKFPGKQKTKKIKDSVEEIVIPSSVQVKGYPKLLSAIIDRRWIVILLAAILVAGSFMLVPRIGSEFMPKAKSNEFTVELRYAEGTKLERTVNGIITIEEMIKSILGENLDVIYSQSGPSTDSDGTTSTTAEGENTGFIKVILNEEAVSAVGDVIAHIESVLSGIEGLDVVFKQDETALSSILGTEDAPLVVEIKGEELDVIDDLSKQVMAALTDVEGIFNIQTTQLPGAPEIDVVLDRKKAGIYQISMSDVASQVNERLSGKDAGEYDYKGEMQDISIKLPEVDLKDLGNIEIISNQQTYLLAELARFEHGYAPKEIHRTNQVRIGKVTAYVSDDIPFDHTVVLVEEVLSKVEYPKGYSYMITGEEQKRKESNSSLTFAMILSIVLVYMVLASQFESLLHPFTIILTIPLAATGSIIAFFILGQTFNMMAYIGIIMLFGIAVNDSIILVDAINRLKEQGLQLKDAIVAAGAQRIRPIIMTSLTTILALLPLSIGLGEGAELRAPMGIAVVGGLITSTLLTLVVIPCFYYILDQLFARKSKSVDTI